MQLRPGQELLHYRLVEKIGEGGMGVVWKAMDTTLDREVAIKVLPEQVASDAARLDRLEREAKLLASLNHPSVATIHGLHECDGTRFLAMEFVPGEDLAERLRRGPLPVEQALRLMAQVAHAVEAAHDGGVIHRDLKPANVRLTPDGKVKVLDFGLAKAFEAAQGSSDPSLSPTLTSAGTVAGVILGTAAYMSPEQAKGKPVDRRADVWSFGVMLWELLVGRMLFKGDGISETMAAVLMAEIDLDALPRETPPRIRRLVERCLRRDPDQRLRDIGDARIVIEESLAGREWIAAGKAAGSPGKRGWLGATALVLIGVIVGAIAAWMIGGGDEPVAAVSHLAVPLPSHLRVRSKPLLTADGRTLVFRAVDISPGAPDRRNRLHVRKLDDDSLHDVEGSKGVVWFSLSPDQRRIAYVVPVSDRSARYELIKLDLDLTSPPVKISDWPEDASWRMIWPNAERLFALEQNGTALIPIRADGGGIESSIPIRADTPPLDLRPASTLPGGRKILVHSASLETGHYRQNVGVLDLESGQLERIVDHGSNPVYSPSGHLLFSRGDTLLAVPFEPNSVTVHGETRAVLDGLWSQGLWTGGLFSVSDAGDLLYNAGEGQGDARHIAVVERDGSSTPWSADRLAFNSVRVSPDGRWIAVQVDNAAEGDVLLQIRVSGFDRPRLETLAARPGMDCYYGVWSTGSTQLAYYCGDGETTELFIDGVNDATDAKRVFEVSQPDSLYPAGFGEDDAVVLVVVDREDGIRELHEISLRQGGDPGGRPLALEETRFTEMTVSPDGRWLAYVSLEGGRRDLYVRPLRTGADPGPRMLAAPDADDPSWGKTGENGRYELLFFRHETLLVVDFVPDGPQRFSEPRKLDVDWFDLGMVSMDTLPDGRLVVARAPDTEIGASEVRLIQNWTRGLK